MAKKYLLIFFMSFVSLGGYTQIPGSIAIDEINAREKESFKNKSAFSEASNYSQYDLIYQRMKWQINPALRYIDGEIISYIKSKTEELFQIEFDLTNALTIDSVISHGNRIDFIHANNKIIIPLVVQLKNEEIDSLKIYYHGEPDENGFGSFAKGVHNDIPVLWTLSEPFGAKDWWPCKQSLVDKIDSVDIIVTSPEQYLTASNGVLASNTINNGLRIMHWKHRYPIATYLVAIAVTNYTVYNDTLHFEDGRILKIENYVYPENIETAKTQTAETVKIMKLFNELIGEYPFSREKYGHAQFGWRGGMEHQTMSFMYNFNFDLVAHELAHQWFGNHITLNSWHDIWLNEGFATYMTGLTYEHLKSENDWYNWKNSTINKITNFPDGSVYVDDTTSVSRIFNSRLSYSKGAYLLHMLRWILGDQKFFNGIRNYFSDPQITGGFASNNHLIMHLEEAGDTSLTEFFDDWYYGEGYPVYSLEFGATSDGKIWINLLQNTTHESVDFFEMPVPVRLFNDDKTEFADFRLENTHNNQQFILDVDFNVGSVIIDPDLWLLSKTDKIVSITDNYSATFIKIYPNPATNHVRIFASGNVEISMITLFNIDGKPLKIFRENLTTINLSDQVPGFYLIAVKTNQGEFIQKIVKR
ncbi:MAG: T9SS type A sorting domain-containing protein [Prolixibacteraceae bacterium]|nr:T9SS type A sorting domain-containing protein [Prolixibacteraceae bacterium]